MNPTFRLSNLIRTLREKVFLFLNFIVEFFPLQRLKTVFIHQNSIIMENKAKYTETLKAKSRTYYLDLKVSSNGTNYLQLTESRKNKEGAFETVRLTVFQDDIAGFTTALNRLVAEATKPDNKEESKNEANKA
jgi:hypothetical protein